MADETKRGAQAPTQNAPAPKTQGDTVAGMGPAVDPRDAELVSLREQLAKANAAKEKSDSDHLRALEDLDLARAATERVSTDARKLDGEHRAAVAEIRRLNGLQGAQGGPSPRAGAQGGPLRALGTIVFSRDGERTKVLAGEPFQASESELAGLTRGVHFERA